jgi:Type VI secretion system/phage-baseplate injector OB domain
MPCVPYAGPNRGFGFLPEKNSGVWIEFEGGDVSYPLWVGGYWREGEFPGDAAEHVKVIITGDHKLEFDDDQGTITLTDNNGNSVTLDSSGITLKNGDTVSVVVSSSSVSVNDGALEVQA